MTVVNGNCDSGHDHDAGFGDDMELEEQRLELIEELLSCSSVDEMAMQEAVDVLLCLGQDVQASSLSDPTEVSVAKAPQFVLAGVAVPAVAEICLAVQFGCLAPSHQHCSLSSMLLDATAFVYMYSVLQQSSLYSVLCHSC